MEELISVIVPIYNVEAYLKKCVESIIHQSYQNLEIILVDDGSPDNCGLICDQMAKEDKRIKVVHQKNGGLSNARNSGIRIANGKYIVFIDSDDWIECDFVSKMYNSAIEVDADLVICGITYLNENGEKNKNVLPGKDGIYSNVETLKFMHGEHRTPYVTAVTKLYKRELFEKIVFPDGKIHEDEFTCYRYIYDCRKVVILNEALYNTVYREGSITTSKYSIKRLDILEALYERIVFYDKHNEISDEIEKIVKEFYGAYAYGFSRVSPSDNSEKKRIAECKEMANKLLRKYSKEIGMKGRIAFRLPKIYLALLSIRNRITHKI